MNLPRPRLHQQRQHIFRRHTAPPEQNNPPRRGRHNPITGNDTASQITSSAPSEGVSPPHSSPAQSSTRFAPPSRAASASASVEIATSITGFVVNVVSKDDSSHFKRPRSKVTT